MNIEELEFCTDCASVHAKGDIDEILTDEEWSFRMRFCEEGFEALEKLGYRAISIKDSSGEKFFVNGGCDCCGGSPGDRFLHKAIRD